MNKGDYGVTCAMDGTTASVSAYHIKKQKKKTSYIIMFILFVLLKFNIELINIKVLLTVCSAAPLQGS